MKLEPNKIMDVIFLRKTIYHIILVFPYSFDEVGCYTGIKCAIFRTCKNINRGLFNHYFPVFLDTGLRRYDDY